MMHEDQEIGAAPLLLWLEFCRHVNNSSTATGLVWPFTLQFAQRNFCTLRNRSRSQKYRRCSRD